MVEGSMAGLRKASMAQGPIRDVLQKGNYCMGRWHNATELGTLGSIATPYMITIIWP